MQSRTKNAKRNAIGGIINRITGILIPFLLRTALIKVLGEEYLGLSNLFTSILQVLNMADLGFGTAIGYSMYKPIAENDTEKICALLNLYKKIYSVISVVILIAGLAVMPFLDKFIYGEYPENINIYVLFFMYLINTVLEYGLFAHRKTLMSACQRSDIENFVNSGVQIVVDTIKVVTLFLFKSYYLYVFFVPVITLLTNLILAAISYKMYPQYRCKGKIDSYELREIKKKVVGLTIQKFGNTISTSLDTIIISMFLGLSSVAVYGNYFYIVSAIISFLWVAIYSTTAGLGDSIVSEGVEKNYLNFKRLTILNQWAISWCLPSLLCLYQHFMKMWVGEKMMSNFSLVIWMCIFFFVSQVRKIVLVFKDATGMWWIDKWKPLVGCIVNLSFNIILVKMIGMEGVIISTVISYLFVELPWETHVLYKNYFKKGESVYYADIMKYVVLDLLICGLCWKVCTFLPDTGIGWFVAKGILCVVLANMIFICIHSKNEMFVDTIKKILKNR